MYDKVLVTLALDHGLARRLLEIAQGLCAPGGEIHALHVVEAPYGIAQATQSEEMARQTFDLASARMREKLAGASGVKGHVMEGHVYRSIVTFAQDHGVSCIVLGSHKPGLSDYFIGSTAARIVRHAPCAVHVHRGA
ncbi:universal stress protein [Sulfitobacter sp. D35]|uniref:universal stress protein n=1 Tax=Sulfitobacter sp. D35 TaxID=3083252 RepID=UPI00296F5193|nr:universal stress protein [Sulfitobacter sp. D35]MDW4500021.1 universal stress protein [Sulfitobacter sp. D35]